MDALDVLPLAYVKENILEVDFEDKDEYIKSLIKTAVAWVEKYTCHYLYERTVTQQLISIDTRINLYPLKTITVTKEGEAVNFDECPRATSLRIYCYGWYKSTLSFTAGYASREEVPGPLLSAAEKLITYMYENHSTYSASLPTDVQMLINQFRRSATV